MISIVVSLHRASSYASKAIKEKLSTPMYSSTTVDPNSFPSPFSFTNLSHPPPHKTPYTSLIYTKLHPTPPFPNLLTSIHYLPPLPTPPHPHSTAHLSVFCIYISYLYLSIYPSHPNKLVQVL